MVTIDISSLPVVTSFDTASSSPANLPGAPTSTADDGHHCPPIPTPSATSTVVIDQSDADMEIGTPISPVAISANQPDAMGVDSPTTSPPSTPVDEVSQPVQATPQPGAATSTPVHAATEPSSRPTLADILKGHEEIRKYKAFKKAAFKVEMPKPLAADLRAIEMLFAEGRHTNCNVSHGLGNGSRIRSNPTRPYSPILCAGSRQ
uniref:AlNc14C81G5299 protein n=1 Tax=Albugo laibachii Nc14 TaxID=890382 RepID=F0WFA7_9STRA|nr:AlNc14C81G5299 [Albugo laibachii Nc14]|eukprot:CCA19889.1 AlNc14C81G5299 [Albugo laibachii Nc14]